MGWRYGEGERSSGTRRDMNRRIGGRRGSGEPNTQRGRGAGHRGGGRKTGRAPTPSWRVTPGETYYARNGRAGVSLPCDALQTGSVLSEGQ